jgi:hypothetical protein
MWQHGYDGGGAPAPAPWWRRRLVPLLVLIGFIVLIGRSWRAEPADAVIRFRLGPAPERVGELRAGLAAGGDAELIATLHRRFPAGAGGPVIWPVTAPAGSYDVEIELTARAAGPGAVASDRSTVRLRRRVELRSDAATLIDLAHVLR